MATKGLSDSVSRKESGTAMPMVDFHTLKVQSLNMDDGHSNCSSLWSLDLKELCDDFIFNAEPPLTSLPEPYHALWEVTLANAPTLVATNLFRPFIEAMPVLDVTNFVSSREKNRGFVVLSFLSQTYLYGGLHDDARTELPNSLAVPLCHLAASLGCKPILNYFSTVLYNWTPIPSPCTVPQLDCLDSLAADAILSNVNVKEEARILEAVSGSIDERWFFYVAWLVDRQSVDVVPLIKAIYGQLADPTSTDKEAKMATHLEDLKRNIIEIQENMKRMLEACLPEVFHKRVRKSLNGVKGNPTSFPRETILYGRQERTDIKSNKLQYENEFIFKDLGFFGPTGAQSPTFHALDVLLSIRHDAHGQTVQGTTSTGTNGHAAAAHEERAPQDQPYLREMRDYMIAPHRKFLQWMETWCTHLRSYIVAQAKATRLREAYNACIKEMERLRAIHFRFVTLYIINQVSKDRADDEHRVDEQVTDGQDQAEKGIVRGTGGTDLVTFLKTTKADVAKSLIP